MMCYSMYTISYTRYPCNMMLCDWMQCVVASAECHMTYATHDHVHTVSTGMHTTKHNVPPHMPCIYDCDTTSHLRNVGICRCEHIYPGHQYDRVGTQVLGTHHCCIYVRAFSNHKACLLSISFIVSISLSLSVSSGSCSLVAGTRDHVRDAGMFDQTLY